MIQTLAPYITVITVIIAGYLTYRNQMRIKSFELLYERQREVLKDIESFLNRLYNVKLTVKENSDKETIAKYLNEYFHEGLILHHKIKGANFGETTDVMGSTFFSIIMEPSKEAQPISEEYFSEWIDRTANTLSMAYSMAHSQLTKDIEVMAFSPLSRYLRNRRKKLTSAS